MAIEFYWKFFLNLKFVYRVESPSIVENEIKQAGDLVGKSTQQYMRKHSVPIEIICTKIDFEKNKFLQMSKVVGNIKTTTPTQPNSLIHSSMSLCPYPIKGM